MRNRKKKNPFSNKKTFNLEHNSNLSQDQSPMIAKKAFEIEVLLKKIGNGILVAQGGDAHGWGLSIENRILQFFVCLGGKIEKVAAVEKLDDKDSKILASVNSCSDKHKSLTFSGSISKFIKVSIKGVQPVSCTLFKTFFLLLY